MLLRAKGAAGEVGLGFCVELVLGQQQISIFVVGKGSLELFLFLCCGFVLMVC